MNKNIRVIKANALKRIKAIHCLSRKYNGKQKKAHEKKLLALMHKHVAEIKELWENKDKHFIIETGDLLILCFEMILENKASIDKVILQCFERYEKKLSQLIAARDCRR